MNGFMKFDGLIRVYDSYVDGYRAPNGALPEMMQLKRIHTDYVVKNALSIAEGESFDECAKEAALFAALLHDTGRYEQLKRYNTFRDSDSVDHAVFSHDIVEENRWLDSCPSKFRDAVLKAVLYHNRRDLPRGLDGLTLQTSHVVRDADKLDIFRVLEDLIDHTDWRKDSRAFWNLSISDPPSPNVIKAIENRHPVDYQAIRSLSDFVLIQVGWMVSDLHFPTARKLCAARGHLSYRRELLHKLTNSTETDRVCSLAEASLASAL